MKSIIDASQAVLVATDKFADYDKVVAVISLARSLLLAGKEVSILLPENKYVQNVLELFDTKKLKQVSQIKTEGVVLRFQTQGAEVENIKWQEKDGEIYIFIDSKKVELDQEKIQVQQRTQQFEVIFLVGVLHLDALGEYYTSNKNIFVKDKIIQIGSSSANIGQYKLSEKSSCFSELVLQVLKIASVDIPETIATDLLAGLLWKTDGLKKVATTLSSTSLPLLMENGANLKKASDKAFSLLTLKDVKLISQILKNLQITQNRVAYSIIKKSQLKEVDFDQIIAPSWFFIDRLRDVDLAFVLIEFDEKVVGIISSRNKARSASALGSQFGAVGDSQWAKFYTEESSDEVKEKLLGSSSSGLKPAEEARPKESEKIKAEDTVPLTPAKEIPQPIKLGNDDEAQEFKGGFTPPPPINPLPPATS